MNHNTFDIKVRVKYNTIHFEGPQARTKVKLIAIYRIHARIKKNKTIYFYQNIICGEHFIIISIFIIHLFTHALCSQCCDAAATEKKNVAEIFR